MASVTPACLSWSSGKDCAFALYRARQAEEIEVTRLLTTVNAEFRRVAMHGVRVEILRRQADAVGLPLVEVPLPWPCSNEDYERLMAEATEALKAEGIKHMVFGDLFLEDIRNYRDTRLASVGMETAYPLWKEPTDRLAREMMEAGVEARVATVDLSKLDASFAGRPWDASFLADLPESVDPCGENGEFHTCVLDGPAFREKIEVETGETVIRDGFAYADLIPI
ncbi:ATP-binding protein [Silicimonas sp. MF1-12-2]|uniref:Dph6-related ATP pyrophosphatase n=1 Tax=Silicimonas sp. MF1-12-2 TaxID=3384793 RepID=UPI0039B59B01